jgi:transcription-repair coupling factor (superfamily II helicase)
MFGEIMDLSQLTSLVAETSEVQALVHQLRKGRGRYQQAMLEAAKPCIIATLRRELGVPLVVVGSSAERSEWLYDQVPNWCHQSVSVLQFPEPDSLPYEDLASDPYVLQQRLRVVFALDNLAQNPESSGRAPLIITSACAVARMTMSSDEFSSACHRLSPGMRVSPIELLKRWVEMGYEVDPTVEVAGTASRRGGIVDIFPPNSDLPVRIEFFGDEIESLRAFDPQTQMSLEPASSVMIIPATQSGEAALGSLFDFLPKNTLVILDDLSDIEGALKELDKQALEERQERIEQGELSEDSPVPYLSWPGLESALGQVELSLVLPKWSVTEDDGTRLESFGAAPSYGGRLSDFLEGARAMLEGGQRLVVASHQVHRLSELLREENILVSPVSELESVPPRGSVVLVQGSLSEGWTMGDTVLLTDAEIFGFTKQRRLIKKRPARRTVFIPELSPGDYAVHADHGIARFAGMTKMEGDSAQRDYLILEFADGGRLFVPTDQADRVTRYIGSGGGPPSLSRLSSQEWARVKKRVKERTQDIAEELLALYAAREVVPGFAYSPDSPWQQELEASFPYVETSDQMEAVWRIKDDMENQKPMDRLVCGDVGYGKTEVALRAAFKAVMSGKQVAILVPTTVLAQQHFVTFSQRLSAFPVTVEMLSRFRSDKEQQAIVDGLVSGSVDICIGTHRLLQKDVAFKDLGLVIIDEEQRFGVAHKERLKQMRREVDVLTLSATPIPRTLHMALVGVRDMSTMETPPEERLPIKTFVGPYSDKLVREAIIREMERDGQVFFVHNRVRNISGIAHRLEELVPEALVAVAHGQMSEDRLEQAMLDFTEREVDVLVCTTIIQAGLDIANVNTLIVNDADRLGLTQLYQLRGRVGRGSNRAYAYFLFPKGKPLSGTVERRLQTILEATELGSGFHIAMKDLEIRGAGNVLGSEQSGHIAAVGFDLYCEMLAEAVEDLKARVGGDLLPSRPTAPTPTIDLALDAYIPEEYVAEDSLRLGLYQRLAKLRTEEEVEQIAVEVKDRFGKIPRAVENLLYLMKIKTLAAQAGVETVSRQNRRLVVEFGENTRIDPAKLEWARQQGLELRGTQLRLDTRPLGKRWAGALKKLLASLA